MKKLYATLLAVLLALPMTGLSKTVPYSSDIGVNNAIDPNNKKMFEDVAGAEEEKPAEKKPAAKKSTAKKPAARNTAAKKTAEKKTTAKKPAAKKTAAKKPAAGTEEA